MSFGKSRVRAISFAVLLLALGFLLGWQFILSRPQEPLLKDFAGEYYLGEGLTIWHLSIKSTGKFSLWAWTDVSQENYSGLVDVTNGELQLITQEGDILAPYNAWLGGTQVHRLIPVKWEQRRYLIFADEVSSFCDRIDYDGVGYYEPRDISYGLFYLRMNDWQLSAIGQPILPNGERICPESDLSDS